MTTARVRGRCVRSSGLWVALCPDCGWRTASVWSRLEARAIFREYHPDDCTSQPAAEPKRA